MLYITNVWYLKVYAVSSVCLECKDLNWGHKIDVLFVQGYIDLFLEGITYS